MYPDSLFGKPDKGIHTPVPPSFVREDPSQTTTNQQTKKMKQQINKALVASLAAAMSDSLAGIHKEELRLVGVLRKAWEEFLGAHDGADDHWDYFDETGAPLRKRVIEFRDAVKAAAEKGGYNGQYVAGFLKSHVDAENFTLRKREGGVPRKATVKFSESQLEKIAEVGTKLALTKAQVKELLAALAA